MTSIPHKPASQTLDYARRAERDAFLQELPMRLTPWEWQDLQSRLAARKFNYEILRNLPIELVHLLASYLEDIDIISSRRVSRRWRELFRSEELCRRIFLQNGFGTQRQLPQNMTWESFLSHKLCRKHFLIQGRPWSAVSHRLPLSRREDLRNVAYYYGKLAYVRYQAYQI
jgi:F-box domain